MKRFLIIILVCILSYPINAEGSLFFRVWFTDKNECGYSIDKPLDFLSEKAIVRRNKQNIRITEEDLPLTERYCKEITNIAGKELCRSKWLNSIIVESNDSSSIKIIEQLPFVKKVEFICFNNKRDKVKDEEYFSFGKSNSNSIYGASQEIINFTNCKTLHSKGIEGNNIYIALLDAGFGGIDTLSEWFDYTRIKFATDVVNPKGNIYKEHNHGTAVLSIMMTNNRGKYIGVAPKCDYALIRTEDLSIEAPYEEDFWVKGAEIADSIGVDILTSSLGYKNKQPAISSIGAEIASKKGMVVINSCGNRDKDGITAPADAQNIIAVGSVNKKGEISSFSSKGYRKNNVVKPDLVALGEECPIIDSDGNIKCAYGSSFAAPIVAGSTALIWQRMPQLTANEVTSLLRECGNRKRKPSPIYGYGIFKIKNLR
ncbi:MAG: S8 family serine peptidase [Bacteroidales bacterium]|nr:S8 family serine peptidase [Bacteroidales bacterium]